MIELISGNKTLRISAFERENTPDVPAYDWINSYIEFTLPELKTQYTTAFNVGELTELKKQINSLYLALLNGDKHENIIFDSAENQLNIRFIKMDDDENVAVDITLRPENPADSVIVKDTFVIDQSYFPAFMSGLDEMINWPE